MKIVTSRFGDLEVGQELIITMTKPVLGFEEIRKYFIVEPENFKPFKWLQAVDDPELAFVIVNPILFFPDYTIEVNPKEIEELKVEQADHIVAYAIVTVPTDYTRMTANLQGPILINTRTNLAKQLVLVNSRHSIRHLLFDTGDAVERKPEPVSAGVPAHV